MARWRLTDKHDLNIPRTEWEYKEIGQTGKQKRIGRPVPTYLDPNDPADFTHPWQVFTLAGVNPLTVMDSNA